MKEREPLMKFERRSLLQKLGLGSMAAALAGTPAAEAAAAPAGSPFLNLRDFGAVGDNKTDDAPALQKALQALAAAGGGQLVVPPGKYVIRTGMAEPANYLNKASSIRLVGCGSASQLVIRTGKAGVAVQVANLDSLVVEGLTFVGTPGERNDARIVFLAAYCDRTTFRDCTFYGLAGADSAGGALLYASHSDLRVERCGFRGCAWGGNPLVDSQGWQGCVVDGCWFLDYGTLNGVYHSKTPIAGTIAWVRAGAPASTPQSSSNSQGLFTVRHTKFDEGAGFGVLVDPGAARVPRVHVDGIEVNCAQFATAGGVSLRNVDYAHIENSFVGYNSKEVSDAVRLVNVTSARLERLFCVQSASRITADAACGKLTLEDCVYKTLNSAAKKTVVL